MMQVAINTATRARSNACIDEATQMVTLNESIAQQCIYLLLRWDAKANENKVIEGGSARFGEQPARPGVSAALARTSPKAPNSSPRKASPHLERNGRDRLRGPAPHHRRQRPAFQKADLIGVTANAAFDRCATPSSRIPSLWEPLYNKARRRRRQHHDAVERDEALKQFAIFGISGPGGAAKLPRRYPDVNIDDRHLGLLTVIRDGDTTPEQAFASESEFILRGR